MTSVLPPWMTDPAVSLAGFAGARIGVSPDRVVHVRTEGLFRPVADWAVVAALGGAPQWWHQAEAVQHALDLIPQISVADLVRAATADTVGRVHIARTCEPGSPVLALLAADRYVAVVETAVRRMGGTDWEQGLLAKLGRNPEVPWEIGVALAKNPHTPDSAVIALSAIEDALIRQPLCDRENVLPLQAQNNLYRDDHTDVRETLGRAPGLAPYIQEVLAHDPYARVRETIARRDDCPPNVLADLAVDIDHLVRAQALLRLRRDHAENAQVTSTPSSPGRPHTWHLTGAGQWNR